MSEAVNTNPPAQPPVTPPVTPPPAVPPATPPPAEPPKPVSSPEGQSSNAPPPEVKYELKAPENSPLQKGDLDAIVAYSKEKGLSPEVAQHLVEREHGAVSRFRQASLDAYKIQADGWLDTSKKDPEIGGTEENFKKSAELANSVFKKYGSPKLGEELSLTSLGNHPELTRFAVRIAKAIGEDHFIKAPDNAAPKKLSDAEIFYPKGNN